MLRLFFLFFLILFYECSISTRQIESLPAVDFAKDTTFIFEFTKPYIIPSFDTLLDSSYPVHSIVETDKDLFFISYGFKSQSLSIYDLKNQKQMLRKKIDLQPDSFGPLKGVNAKNLDTIILMQTNRISLSDTICRLYWSKIINTKPARGFPRYGINDWSNGLFRPEIQNNLMFLPTSCSNLMENNPNYYKRPIEGYCDLSTKEITEIEGSSYSEMFMGENNYGYRTQVYRCINECLHIYAFSPDPYLTIFNIKTKEKERVIARSSFQKENIAPFKSRWKIQGREQELEEKMIHFSTSGGYCDLLYDKYRKLYYRIFYIPQPLMQDDGFFTIYDDYKMILMVLDEHFKLKKEILLPKHARGCFFVTKDGLLSVRMPKRDGKRFLEFDLLKILSSSKKN